MRGVIRRIEGPFGDVNECFSACKKWHIGNFEVSVSMDDSIGAGRGSIIRSDIRVYKGEDDITSEVFPEEFVADEDGFVNGTIIDDDEGVNLSRAMDWCRNQ